MFSTYLRARALRRMDFKDVRFKRGFRQICEHYFLSYGVKICLAKSSDQLAQRWEFYLPLICNGNPKPNTIMQKKEMIAFASIFTHKPTECVSVCVYESIA